MALLRFQVPLDRPVALSLQTQMNLDGEIRTQIPVDFADAPAALRVPTPASPDG